MANSSLFFTRQVLMHLIKQNCILKTFLRNLKVSRISLTSLPSWTNMKLHNIPVTPKLVRKVITKLDLWKVSGPNCVSVVVLKNCESELSYILPELFKTCLQMLEGHSHLLFLFLGMLMRGLQLKTITQLVFFFWLAKS